MIERVAIPIKLVEGATGQLVDASLFEEISEQNANSHSNIWVPALEAANESARGRGENPVAEDVHWRWEVKLEMRQGLLAYRSCAIEWKGITEGLMIASLVGHQSKIEPPKDVLYVEYLSVAPNNRQIIQNPPKLKAVGTVLLTYAIQLSMDEGFQGRLALHSLPSAASWYRDKLKLQSFGNDPAYGNLEYFELSAEVAIKMLESMKES